MLNLVLHHLKLLPGGNVGILRIVFGSDVLVGLMCVRRVLYDLRLYHLVMIIVDGDFLALSSFMLPLSCAPALVVANPSGNTQCLNQVLLVSNILTINLILETVFLR